MYKNNVSVKKIIMQITHYLLVYSCYNQTLFSFKIIGKHVFSWSISTEYDLSVFTKGSIIVGRIIVLWCNDKINYTFITS